MSCETLLIQDDDSVRTITLNRPDDMNAFTRQMRKELARELKTLSRDKSIRCLVITGAGRAFSAGQDLKEATADGHAIDFTTTLRNEYNPIILQLQALNMPTIASINGVAAGMGWSLALACDLRLCSSKAKFVSAFSGIGLVPDCGMSWTLPRLVGYARALEIAWLSEPLTADTAAESNLVSRVIEPDQLATGTHELARRLSHGPTKGYVLTRRAMLAGLERDLTRQLDYEAVTQGLAGSTKDYQEGVAAFIEKRQPEFSGE